MLFWLGLGWVVYLQETSNNHREDTTLDRVPEIESPFTMRMRMMMVLILVKMVMMMMAVMIPVKPLPNEHDEEQQVAEEADKDEQAVEHQDGRQARWVPDV